METGLPDLHLVSPHSVNLVGTAAFDQLHGLFQAYRICRCKDQMQMVRHQDKVMQEVASPVSVLQNLMDDNFRYLLTLKNLYALPGLRCHEVSPTRLSSMFQSTHKSNSSGA